MVKNKPLFMRISEVGKIKLNYLMSLEMRKQSNMIEALIERGYVDAPCSAEVERQINIEFLREKGCDIK